jgi:hypothetical protein
MLILLMHAADRGCLVRVICSPMELDGLYALACRCLAMFSLSECRKKALHAETSKESFDLTLSRLSPLGSVFKERIVKLPKQLRSRKPHFTPTLSV